MKFTANRAHFTKEIQKFLPFVERKTTIPVLANLLLVADKEKLTIMATDLEVSLVAKYTAAVKTIGSVSIPARKLADTLKKMGTLEDSTVTIETTTNKTANGDNADYLVQLSCGPFTTKIPGMAATNFPALAKKPKDGVEIPADVLATLINKTRFAVAEQESRYTLNGALLIVAPESIAMVATDGHRLAHIERNSSKFAVIEAQETIIRKDVLDNLKPFLKDGSVVFAQDKESKNQFFSVGDYTVIARPLTGKFPNWKAVMPQTHNSKDVYLDDKQFAAALGRVNQFADERNHVCRFEVVVNKGLQISASTYDGGSASELVTAVEAPSDAVTVGFNAEYVLDILKTMKDQGIVMKLRDSQSSGLFIPAMRDSEYKLQVVLMPVRL